MNNKITLQEAIESWGEQSFSEENIGEHIPTGELYDLLIKPPDKGLHEENLNHLTGCPVCLQELKNMIKCRKEAEIWDLALPKAAASGHRWPKKIPLEGGKYTVSVRRNIHDNNIALVILQVEDHFREALEGKSVQLLDGRNRVCLEGKITDGEVSQEIENLNELSLQRLHVRPNGK